MQSRTITSLEQLAVLCLTHHGTQWAHVSCQNTLVTLVAGQSGLRAADQQATIQPSHSGVETSMAGLSEEQGLPGTSEKRLRTQSCGSTARVHHRQASSQLAETGAAQHRCAHTPSAHPSTLLLWSQIEEHSQSFLLSNCA